MLIFTITNFVFELLGFFCLGLDDEFAGLPECRNTSSACISPGQIIHNSYGAIMFRSGLV